MTRYLRNPYRYPEAGDIFEGHFGVTTEVLLVEASRVHFRASNGLESSLTVDQWPEAIRHARVIRRAEDGGPSRELTTSN